MYFYYYLHVELLFLSRSFRFCGCCWAMWSFCALQRFSVGLRSGNWLGPSRTSCVICWETQPWPIPSVLGTAHDRVQIMMIPPHASPLGWCFGDCPHLSSSSKPGKCKLKHNISILISWPRELLSCSSRCSLANIRWAWTRAAPALFWCMLV